MLEMLQINVFLINNIINIIPRWLGPNKKSNHLIWNHITNY
jgi:hypothetical protein